VAVKLEQMAGRGSGVGKVDPIQASAAQQAVKDRLDLLYRVFKLFAEKSKQDAGYTTLTRGSLEKIFDCLVDTYGFSGVPNHPSRTALHSVRQPDVHLLFIRS
jgi:hypothetical protein